MDMGGDGRRSGRNNSLSFYKVRSGGGSRRRRAKLRFAGEPRSGEKRQSKIDAAAAGGESFSQGGVDGKGVLCG
jgi:hypothetical protein